MGLQAVWLPPQTLTLPLGLPDLPFHLRIDPLAGFFLMLLGSVSAGISVYAAGVRYPVEVASLENHSVVRISPVHSVEGIDHFFRCIRTAEREQNKYNHYQAG